MQPLPTFQKILTSVCLLSTDNGAKKLEHIFFTIFLITTQVIAVIAPTLFIIKLSSVLDLGRLLFACTSILNRCSMLYVVVIAFILRKKIRVIFQELSRIYEACKN